MEEIWTKVREFLPLAITVVAASGVYLLVNFLLRRQSRGKSDKKIIHQIVQFGILFVSLILVILVIPMSDEKRGQITNLLGILVSAIFALSSATFIGNMLAGILLRLVNNFKPGDFIEIGTHFGRVSERTLLYTELQTIDSDLVTLPNLYLATNPVKVKRTAGTFVSATVSLGYDVARSRVEKCLLEAAERAGLLDAFVNIVELGDFSIVYEIYGRLTEVKKIISTRSLLRAMMLDVLHENNIEIVSPIFHNQRQVNDMVFIPKAPPPAVDTQATAAPEFVIFEKAEKAESIEKRLAKIDELDELIKEYQGKLKDLPDAEKPAMQERIDKARELQDKIKTHIETAQDKLAQKD